MFWFFEAFFETAISTCDLKEKEMISEKLEACLFNTFFLETKMLGGLCQATLLKVRLLLKHFYGNPRLA